MIKKLPQTIDRCERCPYFDVRDNMNLYFGSFCNLANKILLPQNDIPDWCPLEDEK
jgi:hypothetical protein